MKKVIAPLGMPGGGKTEAIEYLQKKYAWPKVYFGEVTFDEVKRLGLEINEKNERLARESLRDNFGEDHYAKEVIKKIEALGDAPVVLVESLYSYVEYKAFKEKYGDDFVTVLIHASPKTRYARLANRPVRPLTADEAESRDVAQLNRQTQGHPIALADYVVINEGTQEELYQALDGTIKKILG
nr:AAA domain protein [uncultured bacterium]